MCGDHLNKTVKKYLYQGSPPHVRGPHHCDVVLFYHFGITPACAGTTHTYATTLLSNGDHPRMCGDHQEGGQKIMEIRGSPPHVRGPPHRTVPIPHDYGITPACAGTT